jgi:hypothetical protein
MSENTDSGPDLPPLPMTVASPLKASYQCQTVIGVHPNRKTYYPSNPKPNNYWFLAINRYTLNADYNVVQASNDAVPAGIAPYDNTDYMLVVTTYAVSTNYVPQGPLYAFLFDNGASRQLQRLEQINGALSCGEISTIAVRARRRARSRTVAGARHRVVVDPAGRGRRHHPHLQFDRDQDRRSDHLQPCHAVSDATASRSDD